MLLERDDERAALEDLMAGARAGAGGAVVVEGPPGAGKSRLVAEAVAGAGPAGLEAITARGSELERGFPFGVVRQLLEGPVGARDAAGRAALLEGAARHAVPVLDLGDPGAGEEDPHVAVHGLYWLTANLADAGPLLIAVDDAQWADEASLRYLSYLARRVGALPVAVVVAARAGEPVGALAAVRASADRVLAPAPLSTEAVGALIGAELGEPAGETFARVCRERTGGNPFLVSELAAHLRARGVRPLDAAAPEAAGALPEGVGAATQRRLAALGGDARELARALAVLDDGADLTVAAALAGLDPSTAAAAAAGLAAAGVIDDGHPLRFRHPLLQAGAYAEAPGLWRGSAHAQAARLLSQRGAPRGRVAAHLLASAPGGGDAWAVEQLRTAARAARAQGAPGEASALLRRALAEPPSAESRADVLQELGAAEFASLRPGAAEALNDALALADEPALRAETALRLAVALYYGGDHSRAVNVLIAAIEELGGDPALREEELRLEAFLGVAGRYDLATEARTRGRVGRVASGLAGSTPAERLVRSVAALESPGATAAELAEAARLGEEADGERPWPDPGEGAGTVAMYVYAGRPDLAAGLAARMRSEALRRGSPLGHAVALASAGLVALDTGDLRSAVTDMSNAVETMGELGAGTRAPTVGYLVVALVEVGSLDAADALLSADGLDGSLPERMLLNPVLYGRGLLRAAQRRFDEAARDLLELGARHDRWGILRPSPAWRSAAALALAGAGADPAGNEGPADLAARELELARSWGTPKGIAVATRAVALTGSGGGSGAVPLLTRALETLEGTPWRLERARIRCDLGAALRRAGERRQAREQLMRAMDDATACGAEPLAQLAARESRSAGARPRRHALSGAASLTASERRVAELAAAGRTNREIAHELFVTLATVETHLTRVYRKLGIEGRTGLEAALEATGTG